MDYTIKKSHNFFFRKDKIKKSRYWSRVCNNCSYPKLSLSRIGVTEHTLHMGHYKRAFCQIIPHHLPSSEKQKKKRKIPIPLLFPRCASAKLGLLSIPVSVISDIINYSYCCSNARSSLLRPDSLGFRDLRRSSKCEPFVLDPDT